MKRFFQKNLYYVIAFLGAIIPRIFLNIFAYPVRTVSDEISTISNGAFLAGYDWSSVLGTAGYYGSGMTLLFAPIIRLIDNPIWMYRIMLICESFLYGIIAIICCYIIRKIFGIKDEKYCCLVSIACSYVVAVRTMIVYNEHMLMLLSWIFILIILQAGKNLLEGRSNVKLTVMCVGVLVYSITVHTRAVIFWGAVIVAIVLGKMIYKKYLFSIPVLVILGGILSFFANQFNNYMKENLWLKNDIDILRNETVSSEPIVEILRPRTWHAWGNIIFGQVQTINVLMGGIFLAVIVLVVTLTLKNIQLNKLMFKLENQEEGLIIIVGWFCFSAIGVTILGQIASWGVWATDGMSLGLPSPSYGIKAFTYIRYFAIYCGPLAMLFFVWCYKQRKWFERKFKMILLLFFQIEVYWFCAVIPYIYQNGTLTEVYIPFAFWNEGKEIDVKLFLPASLICLGLMLIFYQCYKKKRIYYPVMVTIFILIFQYVYNAKVYDYNNQKRSYDLANTGYQLIEQIETETTVPHDIYVNDGSGKQDHQSFMIYQFLLKDYHIIPGISDVNLEETITFSNCILDNGEELFENGYKMAQLDENEYIYVKGKDLQGGFERIGVIWE